MKNTKVTRKRGFTLIELLVVIAIIGILSSVVLASLRTAREKGADAAAKSNLANARAQAELYYDDSGQGYDGVCTDVTIGIAGMVEAAAKAVNDNDPADNCDSTANEWAAFVDLRGGDWWCVDAAGASREVGGPLGLSTLICPIQ